RTVTIAAPRLPQGARKSLAAPVRLAELAEDLAQPIVYSTEDGGSLGKVRVRKRGQARDGRVDPRVTGGDRRRPKSF
ncbi:MAG: hypothetical protein ACRDNS_01965, partial [Trebonia sp.]